MKVIEYSKANGFTEVDFEPEWKDGESHETWLTHAGFEPYGPHDGLESEREHGRTVSVHYPADGATHNWAALVDISDGDGVDYVLVRTRADLLNLRMALTPFHAASVMQRFDAFVGLAEKAFCAWHGHQHYLECRQCDPDAVQDSERRKREAKK